ncbi:MAG: hypothetical protein ACKVJP_04955 [Flavobacteriales bacterium]|tara:strand:- start:830 stop:2074 length:1245 start_codon:yes stop_codon:yes gene_type:complete
MQQQETQSLSITSKFFKILIEEIYNTFKKKHALEKLPKSFQLYGYGDYDESKPSLKNDLEAIGTEFINGKYLYDKARQAYKGRPIIKFNRYYKSIVLLYLGYTDFKEFIDANNLDENENDRQLSLLYNKDSDKIYYYINHYFGEDNTLLKGQTIISENFKKIQHIYIYPQEDGTFKSHHNFGTIVRREDTIHVNTKTLLDGKLVEGGNEIYYIAHNDPSNTNFLVGTYCAFDIYTQTVSGKVILEKCDSKEEMEARSKNKLIPPYIALELRNKRIVNSSIVPKHYLELSENSPYSAIYAKIPGIYQLTFKFEDDYKEVIEFKIREDNYKIIPLSENVYFEKDNIELLNKGSIIHLSIKFAGIIALDKVDIYFKTYYLKENSENQDGVFSGIDNENRLVNGNVAIEFNSDLTALN